MLEWCADNWDCRLNVRINGNQSFIIIKIEFVSPDVYALQTFGSSYSLFVLDDVQCTGNEASLLDCSALSVIHCDHNERAAVRCHSGEYNK